MLFLAGAVGSTERNLHRVGAARWDSKPVTGSYDFASIRDTGFLTSTQNNGIMGLTTTSIQHVETTRKVVGM